MYYSRLSLLYRINIFVIIFYVSRNLLPGHLRSDLPRCCRGSIRSMQSLQRKSGRRWRGLNKVGSCVVPTGPWLKTRHTFPAVENSKSGRRWNDPEYDRARRQPNHTYVCKYTSNVKTRALRILRIFRVHRPHKLTVSEVKRSSTRSLKTVFTSAVHDVALNGETLILCFSIIWDFSCRKAVNLYFFISSLCDFISVIPLSIYRMSYIRFITITYNNIHVL